MTKLIATILGSFFLFLVQPAVAAPDPSKWAVIVGVNEYQRTGVSDLKYAVSDAKLFADTLTEVIGVPNDQVFVYTTDAAASTEMPRLTNLVYRLEWLKEHVKKDDTIFFYFAGHGVETEGETFLLMDNADNRSKATLTMSTLQSKLLFEMLSECKAKDTLVVLDACRNDPAAGRGSEDNRMSESMSRGLVFKSVGAVAGKDRNLATLFACNVGERSYEWPEKGHGYFTYYLVEGLKTGAAASGKGQVTLAGLSTYVRNQVTSASEQAGDSQQPTLRYEGPGPERWVLSQGSGTGSAGAPENAESRLQKALQENARLREENSRLQTEVDSLRNHK